MNSEKKSVVHDSNVNPLFSSALDTTFLLFKTPFRGVGPNYYDRQNTKTVLFGKL